MISQDTPPWHGQTSSFLPLHTVKTPTTAFASSYPARPAFSLPCTIACRREPYTCWNQASGARVNNYGSRIDLILAADAPSCQPGQGARVHISFCDISPERHGSDHAPVWADLTADTPLCRASTLPRLASKNLFTGAPLHRHPRTCWCLCCHLWAVQCRPCPEPHCCEAGWDDCRRTNVAG